MHDLSSFDLVPRADKGVRTCAGVGAHDARSAPQSCSRPRNISVAVTRRLTFSGSGSSSFMKIELMCFSTARFVRNSELATAALLFPFAISARISSSRGVSSSSSDGSRCRPRASTSASTTFESTSESFAATALMASTSWSASCMRSLRRYARPAEPDSSNENAYCGSTNWLMTTTPISGCVSRRIRAARIPASVPVGGIRMSVTTTFGRRSSVIASSDSKSSQMLITLISWARSRICSIACRARKPSSAITTGIALSATSTVIPRCLARCPGWPRGAVHQECVEHDQVDAEYRECGQWIRRKPQDLRDRGQRRRGHAEPACPLRASPNPEPGADLSHASDEHDPAVTRQAAEDVVGAMLEIARVGYRCDAVDRVDDPDDAQNEAGERDHAGPTGKLNLDGGRGLPFSVDDGLVRAAIGLVHHATACLRPLSPNAELSWATRVASPVDAALCCRA